MDTLSQLKERLRILQQGFESITGEVTVGEQEALVQFFVDILPKVFGAERCGIFLVNPSTGTLLSRYGTGLAAGKLEVPAETSVAGRVFKSRTPYLDNQVDGAEGVFGLAEATTGFKTRNILCVPIFDRPGTGVTGVVQVLNRQEGFSEGDVELLGRAAKQLSGSLESLWTNGRVLEASKDITRDFDRVRSLLSDAQPFVASDPAMAEVITTVHAVSGTPAAILLRGENGTGKELVARMIYENSLPASAPFVAVNCAAIPENLLESEFFGYQKGAFTGAGASRGGVLEEASGGILFLDEVGELALGMQAKLLRVLQEREGRRVGGTKTIPYSFRLLSATNRNLEEMVKEGSFREDLYYRLFAVSVEIPPLRDRRGDIGLMATRFLREISEAWGKEAPELSREALGCLERCPWPGNVRQLRREIERIVTLVPAGEAVSEADLSEEVRGGVELSPERELSGTGNLRELTRRFEAGVIERALSANQFSRSRTAKALGITRQTLYVKLKQVEHSERGGL